MIVEMWMDASVDGKYMWLLNYYQEIQKFIDKYKKIPTKTSLNIEIENRKDLNQDTHDKIVKLISSLDATDVDIDWLLETTEKFCKDRAIYNAIVEGVNIIDGKDKDRTPEPPARRRRD